ncbi:Electron transport complex protein RnfD [Candidatus Izimaplasma bacterium HR1]|jgi:electron transport complex protein RnfD|uniref:RnfABCDGE type electron transport complex subunit D n=1 Tax=Candidatus Izimoplasma sp. HR1 TaxID=1541959 RepID=UPI0004F60847|nr:Electron transport complex protein RnfD [Candidatus Izimaplasma bacterium HR1]
MIEHQPKIIRKTSPYLRRPQASVSRMMRDVVIALLPITIFAIYSFGMDAVKILSTAIISMVLAEYFYYQIVDKIKGETFKFKNKSFTLYNFSALTSGLIYGLTLPDQTPIWVVAVSGILGIFLAKLIFGGLGQNVFNPAAVARVIVVVNFAIAYGSHTADFALAGTVDGMSGATALQYTNFAYTSDAGQMITNAFNPAVLDNFSLMNLFTGMGIPGSLGEVSAILLILGGIYLALRTSFEVRIPLAYVGTVFLLAGVVAIQQGLGLWYPVYHVLSGGLLFGAIFMATDPITSPITKPGRIYFGFGLGVITFFIRLFGALPEGVVFSILIMNMFVPTFDYFKWSKSRFTNKGNLIFAGVIVATILVTVLGVHYGF